MCSAWQTSTAPSRAATFLASPNEAMTFAGKAMDMMLATPAASTPEASSAAAAERASDVSSDVAFV